MRLQHLRNKRRGALGTFVAGAYVGTYTPPAGAAAALGITETGYRIGQQFRYQEINETDVWGETTIDVIFRGQRCEIGGIFDEVNAPLFRLMFPFTGTVTPTGATNLQAGVVGGLGSDSAGAVVLTAVAGTPAASTPATQTFPLVIPAPGFDFERVFNSKLRQTPFRLLALPKNFGAGDNRFWSAT